VLGQSVIDAAVILVLAAPKHAFPRLRQPAVNPSSVATCGNARFVLNRRNGRAEIRAPGMEMGAIAWM
jgi:hypothetical protein